jgi:asparagine synthase (glutamine-hydrolysing)
MSNEAGTAWIVYNGEVVNFGELRQQLIGRGCSFQSRTDTETVLRLYERDGAAALKSLRGMFAFAIWEEDKRRLFAARDPLGVKPLYYAWDGRTLIFASELKAFAASALLDLTVNPAAIAAYLELGSIPAPLTIYREVQALLPGHALTFEDGGVRTYRYWDIAFEEDGRMTEEAALDRLRALLAESVKLQLISDVPLGVFLSGGVDSSSLVALMRQEGQRQLKTFSVTFAEAAFSEASFARKVAEMFETDHIEHVVGAREVLDDMDRVVAVMDQPTIDGVNTYFVSKITRQAGVVVALSGLGGDELFGGYSSFRIVPYLARLAQAAHRVPLAATVLPPLTRLFTGARYQPKLQIVLDTADLRAAYLGTRGLYLGADLEQLLAPDFYKAAVNDFDPLAYLGGVLNGHAGAAFNEVSWLELRTYMHNQLLRDTDVMSMAHSLEVRVPLIDRCIVEFVATVPVKYKIGRKPKRLLVDSLGTLLPRSVWMRPKRGFSLPFADWLRGPMHGLVADTLSDASLRDIPFVQPHYVREVQGRFLRGTVHWSRVWALVVLAQWMRDSRR